MAELKIPAPRDPAYLLTMIAQGLLAARLWAKELPIVIDQPGQPAERAELIDRVERALNACHDMKLKRR